MSEAPKARSPVLVGVAIGGCLVLALAGLVAMPVFSAIALIAIPNFMAMQKKAKRAELPGNVASIKTLEHAYDAAFDGYAPASSREQAEAEIRYGAGRALRRWDGDPGFNTIGFRPDGDVRGAYWVEVRPDGRDFTVHAICDVDGNGEFAEYTATSSISATLVTHPDVY
jgi:hypothetical protein